MNIIELFSASFSAWKQKMLKYAAAGLALFFATSICVGWLSATLIIDGVIALSAGMPYGAWAASIPHVVVIAFASVVGIVATSFFLFSLWGGFLNACGKLAGGSSDASILDMLSFGFSRSRTFWAIGLMQIIVGTVFALPGLTVSVFFPPLGLPLAIVGYFFAGTLFTLFYVAAAEGCRTVDAIKSGIRAAIAKPVAWIAMLVACAAIYGVGFITGPAYPLYHFLVASPIAALFQIGYYRAATKK